MSELSEAMVTAGVNATDDGGLLTAPPRVSREDVRTVLAAALRVLVDEADRREAIMIAVPSLTRIADAVERPAEDGT